MIFIPRLSDALGWSGCQPKASASDRNHQHLSSKHLITHAGKP